MAMVFYGYYIPTGDLLQKRRVVEKQKTGFPAELIISADAASSLLVLWPNRATGACAWTLSMPGMPYQCIALL